MNILFLCDMHEKRPWARDRLPGLTKASEAYASRVYIRDIYDFFGPEVSDNLKEAPGRDARLLKPDINAAEDYFLKEMSKYDIDVIVLATADNYREFITIDFIQKLKRKGLKLVGFLGDDEFNYPQYKYLAALFDNFVVYVQEFLEYYETLSNNKGFLLLNSCHLESSSENQPDSKAKYDTVMIGGPIAHRVRVLRKLQAEGFSIAIYGPKTWLNYPDLAGKYRGFVATEEFDERLSEGRIILSMLEDHLTGNMHMNTKIWECARAGVFTIASRYEPLYSSYGFTERDDIVTYKDEDDLIQKFKFYLQHSEARNSIKNKFLEKVKSELDYEKLYLQLFNSFKEGLKDSAVVEYELRHKDINVDDPETLGVFYNIVQNNKPVKQYFPFINPNSINIFDAKMRWQVSKYFFLFCNRKKFHHVNLYVKVGSEFRWFATMNRLIHAVKYEIVKPYYQRFIIPLRRKFVRA